MAGKSMASGSSVPRTSSNSPLPIRAYDPATLCLYSVLPQHVTGPFTSEANMTQGSNQQIVLFDGERNEKLHNFGSGSELPNVAEDGSNGPVGGGREGNEVSCQRLKWSETMVRLLITAVSSLRKDLTVSPTQGKWKAVSDFMVERGYHVSPAQCEYKFNDTNKKYRKLNHLLGVDTARVVQQPGIVDSLNLEVEVKYEVRKLLNNIKLFYDDLYNYHNGDLHLLHPHPALQQTQQSAPCGKSYHNSENSNQGISGKRKFQEKEQECLGLKGLTLDLNAEVHPSPPNWQTHPLNVSGRNSDRERIINESITTRKLQLEKNNLQLESENLKLEEQRFKLLKEDMELGKLMLKNKLRKLENEKLAFELKCQETDADGSE